LFYTVYQSYVKLGYVIIHFVFPPFRLTLSEMGWIVTLFS
jgi:hypothetical protein